MNRTCRALVFSLVLFFAGVPLLFAQQTSSSQSDQKKQVTSYTLSPEKYQQAIEYSRAKYRLYFIATGYGMLILLLVLSLGLSARFRDWAESGSSRRIIQVVVYAPLLMLALAVLGLPTDLYGHWLRLKYDQSVQSWGSWAWDWSKAQLIGLVIMTLFIWILYGIIRRSPKRWWFYFWLASIPIIVFLLFITPVVIEPLFFKFEPLDNKQPALVMEIEKVVQRGGLEIPRDHMFEMKASEKLKSVNAYVTGFSASKRVVVWDTTIAKMTPPQILFVFGHEMGHYVLGHVPKTIAFICIMLLVFLFLGYQGMRWVVNCWGARWQIRGIDDWASLPVLMLFLSFFSFLSSPLVSSYSRHQEHDADIYGLEVIHGIVPEAASAAAEAFQILGEINLSDPDPSAFIKIWLYSHPPLSERLIFAREYDPWSKGEPPKFVK
ncbi:MAG TPA: M48 family metallopeptidase [Acidobacteriota bacterium]